MLRRREITHGNDSNQRDQRKKSRQHQAGRHGIVTIGEPNEGSDAKKDDIAAEETAAMTAQTTMWVLKPVRSCAFSAR